MENQVETPVQNNKLKRLKEVLDSLNINLNNTSLIQDNKIIYIVNNQTYRTVMPNQRERVEAEDRRDILYTKLVTEGKYKTESQWRKILKENQDIDIAKLEVEKDTIIEKLKDTLLTLNERATGDPSIVNLKTEIKEIHDSFQKLSIQIADYLQPCIESRLKKEYIEYLTYACTEKPEKDNWVKVWNSFEDYQKDNSIIAHKAIEYLTKLIFTV